MQDPREGLVGIIGAGAAGLVTGHTLTQDGFTVRLLTRDDSPGGVWAAKRVYPGLAINNVHGEFRFSALPMPPPADGGGRLGGLDMQQYMEAFADKFLKGMIRYGVEVDNVRRDPHREGFLVDVTDLKTRGKETQTFRRIVVCSGGCSNAYFPPTLSPFTAKKVGFRGPVLHSQQFRERIEDVLAACKGATGRAVVVGGGKSAQDVAAYLANQGIKVSVVFDSSDAIIAAPVTLPGFIRRSRLLSIMSPSPFLRSKLERFLHTTWLGGKIVQCFWAALSASSLLALGVPWNSPLRRAQSLFWSIRVNDEGTPSPTRFHGLVNRGKIDLVAPARAVKFGDDSKSVVLANGASLPADVVIMATGYQSSWTQLFPRETFEGLGLARHPSGPQGPRSDQWHYTSLTSPPPAHPAGEQWASSLYRGIVPVKNLNIRDFAVNGATFTTNNGYVFETCAHWISAYFLGERMRIPSSDADAIAITERNAAWMRKRHPDMLLWANESYATSITFWNWPQAMDELLDDLYLRSARSGGNCLTWPFKVIDIEEISALGEERRKKRAATHLA